MYFEHFVWILWSHLRNTAWPGKENRPEENVLWFFSINAPIWVETLSLIFYDNYLYLFLPSKRALHVQYKFLLQSWPETICLFFSTTLLSQSKLTKLRDVIDLLREALKRKLRDYLGIFPKRRTPPHPPFWEPLVQKKKLCLFCILGVKDHFCSSQKNHFLSGIFTTRFGNKGPPPPFRKNSQIIPYFFMREDNSDNGSLPLNDY